MPSFLPPLAHTENIKVSDTQAVTKYAHLTFRAEFAEGEDTSGVWQIWSDVPFLGPNGETPAPGEWRAADFKRTEAASIAPPSSSESPKADLYLEATHSTTADKDIQSNVLTAAMVIKPAIDARFEYTFRHVLPSGEIQWGGSGGSNGVIMVERSDEDVTELAINGAWEGAVASQEQSGYAGGAIWVEEEQGIPTLRVATLPSAAPISARVIIAAQPRGDLPFSTLSSSSKPSAVGDTTSSIVLASANDIALDAHTVLPPSSTNISFVQASSAGLPEATREAIAAIGSTGLKSVPFQSSDSANIVVLTTTHSPAPSASRSLAVYRQLALTPTTVSLDSAPFTSKGVPLLVSANDGSPILLPTTRSQINIGLRAGSTSAILKLTSFTKLPSDQGEAVCIAAPSAASIELGEEQIQYPASPPSELQTASREQDTAMLAAAPEIKGTHEDSVDDEEDDESIEPPPDANQVSAVTLDDSASGWWFFSLFGKMFVQLWELITGSFRTKQITPASATPTETFEAQFADVDASTEFSQDVDTDVPVTPADERSPLLGSPGISRNTSTSTMSPLGSPQSFGTMTKSNYHTSMASAESGAPLAVVATRQYLEFTFNHLPPFLVYVAGTSSRIKQLSFEIRGQGKADWEKLATTVENETSDYSTVSIGQGLSGSSPFHIRVWKS